MVSFGEGFRLAHLWETFVIRWIASLLSCFAFLPWYVKCIMQRRVPSLKSEKKRGALRLPLFYIVGHLAFGLDCLFAGSL